MSSIEKFFFRKRKTISSILLLYPTLGRPAFFVAKKGFVKSLLLTRFLKSETIDVNALYTIIL